MARDNFSKRDIVTLRTRVGDRCSNPDCRKTTTGPANDKDKATILGDAAHICAASKGGPRYASEMTPSERKSINNAIWLCKACARRIDVDYKSYPKELLYKWKENAEQKAREELNQPLFSQYEVNQQVISHGLSMMNGIATTKVCDGVHNAIQAEIKFLENKDPRFNITYKIEDNAICYQLLPKENLNISMSYLGENNLEFNAKYSAFIKSGKDLFINAEDISFSGSELFKYLEKNVAIVQFSHLKRKAVVKLWSVERKNNRVINFDDIVGKIAFGTEEFSFSGEGLDGILNLDMLFSITNKCKFSLNLSLEKWEQKNILNLPYFYKLWLLFSNIERNFDLFFLLS